MKSIVSFLITLWIIITLTFLLIRLIPGDPFSEEQALPEEIQENLRQHYGLNDSWTKQYGLYIKSIVTWNFGPSFKYKDRTVNDIIREGFPVSAILGLEALTLAISLGIFLGTLAALYQYHWQDSVAMLIATFGISIPGFMIAVLLQYIFAIKLGILPIARWGSFLQTILPALSLAALPIAFLSRLTRSNMIEVLRTDYIKTARAKGLSQSQIIISHALKNALLPILPYFGQLAANILVGSFVIEKIFGLPGLGRWFVMSVMNRDYTVIMGTTVFYGIIMLLFVYISDAMFRRLDPRLR